jgi:hypothetical protein
LNETSRHQTGAKTQRLSLRLIVDLQRDALIQHQSERQQQHAFDLVADRRQLHGEYALARLLVGVLLSQPTTLRCPLQSAADNPIAVGFLERGRGARQ